MKKRIILPYLLLAATLLVAIGLFFRTNSLQNQLQEQSSNTADLNIRLLTYEELLSKDSLLLDGDYDDALVAYEKIAKEIGDDRMGVKLRIALAEKIKTYSQHKNEPTQEIESDSLTLPNASDPIEIRRYDSLSFAHEKVKIQLDRLRKQLKQKSFGEYLTFKSKKGNKMHYVGQVKNNKANGYGIAFLDTGSRYEGQWKDNQRHGEGKFYWPDGEYYVGTYVNDKRNEHGAYYWPNGEKYVGSWKDDKRNGKGEFYASDGNMLTSGTWEDDKLVEAQKKSRR